MYTRLWKLITKYMEENSRMAVFLTSAMLIWTIGITMAGILVCIIKHMNVICRLRSDLCRNLCRTGLWAFWRRMLFMESQKSFI